MSTAILMSAVRDVSTPICTPERSAVLMLHHSALHPLPLQSRLGQDTSTVKRTEVCKAHLLNPLRVDEDSDLMNK